MKDTTGWWTTVTFGSESPMPPHGPWKSREEAEAAMTRWRDQLGAYAGTYVAAHNTGIVGPFRTREAAQNTDISTYDRDIRRSWAE